MNQDKLHIYAKQFGVRFTRREKNKAAAQLIKDFAALNYEADSIIGKKLINKAKDIFFGNRKTAKNVIVVPYDTPERKLWHNVLYYPFDGSKTANKTMAATFVPIIGVYALILVGVFFGGNLFRDPLMSNLLSLLMFLLLVFLVYFMTHGIHNKNNYTRNSASIIAALQIAEGLNKDERRRTAFLFTDKNKSRFLGATSAANDLKAAGKNPNIILLDCIGTGSIIQIGYKPQNRKLAQDIAKSSPLKDRIDVVKMDEQMLFQNAATPFDKAVTISCGECDSEGKLYVKGTCTAKDCMIDASTVDSVADMVCAYLKSVK